MKNAGQLILVAAVIFSGISSAVAQAALPDKKKTVVLSAVQGTASKPDTVVVDIPSRHKKLDWSGKDTLYFTAQLLPFVNSKHAKLVVLFKPATGFTGIARAVLQVHNADGTTTIVHCSGLSTKGLEGENEAPLAMIAGALNYQLNTGWTALGNHIRPELQGEESVFSLFRKAGKGKVEMLPVARYSPDFELPFGYYTNTGTGPVKHQAGILAKKGEYPEHQTLFPSIASGSRFFDPGTEDFGFYTSGPSHQAYSEDIWNMLLHPENAMHAVRIYPVKNKEGVLLTNTWLVCFEEAKNGDYNDYVFLVKNIVPVKQAAFRKIFNGINLQGWHSFINGRGNDTAVATNFPVEDSVLHVKGKELGYVITDSAYRNFHLKVDFKWGEKKWPPRENAKRDAGICYNIPLNEPDSIWPVSIECQVQEGDVGDFWLLGFSTITVDGKINDPSNHTRVIKKKDGENTTGQWNTVEIISYNGTCAHIVNGVLVNYGTNASVKEGRILLQSEYAEVFYRNVYLKKL